eukprot:COSAG02_NODE_17501_length_999_cov_1.217778_2_plen_177_part_00
MSAADILRQRQQARAQNQQLHHLEQPPQGADGQRWASASASPQQLGQASRHILNPNRGSTSAIVAHQLRQQQERRQPLPSSMVSLLAGQTTPGRVYNGGRSSHPQVVFSKQLYNGATTGAVTYTNGTQGAHLQRSNRSGLHVVGEGSRANSKLWRSILAGGSKKHNGSSARRSVVW